MQSVSSLLILSLLCPSLAFAGEIHGTITEGGRSVGQGVSVDIRCGQKSYSATTDKYGSYRAFIPEQGTCDLHVNYQGQSPSRAIESFEDSVRYDLALEKQGGTYTLGRR